MALGDDIRVLRDRALTDLNAAHDYYTDTKVAWRIVHQVVAAGHKFSIRNVTTGTVTTQADLANKARGYLAEQVTEATFHHFISIFENFIFDFLRRWLVAYPGSLIGKQVDFRAVLDAPDKDAIMLLVVNKELNELSYDRPAAWFAYLEDRAKLGCPTADESDRIAEAKASRDVLVHNRGIASKTYESKAGRLMRYKDGQRIDVPEYYLGAHPESDHRHCECGNGKICVSENGGGAIESLCRTQHLHGIGSPRGPWSRGAPALRKPR